MNGVCECGETDPTYNLSGNVTEDVNDTAGTNTEFDTLIENVLNPEDITAIENGSSFEVVLEVTDIKDSVPPTDVNAVSAAFKSDEKIGVYVEMFFDTLTSYCTALGTRIVPYL